MTITLQPSPNRWSCLPTCLAMALNVPVAHVIKQIGHDGSDIWWPNQPESMKRRGFTPDDINLAAIRLGAIPVTLWLTAEVAPTDAEIRKVVKTKIDLMFCDAPIILTKSVGDEDKIHARLMCAGFIYDTDMSAPTVVTQHDIDETCFALILLRSFQDLTRLQFCAKI